MTFIPCTSGRVFLTADATPRTRTHTHTLQESTAHEITDDCFEGGEADLAVGDEAPDITGQHNLNEYVLAHLLLTVSDHRLNY